MNLRDILEKAFLNIETAAMKRKGDAVMGGRFDDGGYRSLMHDIRVFKAGIEFQKNGSLPGWIEAVVKDIAKSEGLVYEDYVKLHRESLEQYYCEDIEDIA